MYDDLSHLVLHITSVQKFHQHFNQSTSKRVLAVLGSRKLLPGRVLPVHISAFFNITNHVLVSLVDIVHT